ncbi:MAG: epoxyqueuosine reductase [Blastocatellia bacterium]|jgi:epoxyqueuosine reductase|nr:epoxyqueuosine reductase [Blastocatellia bacterium]
MTAPQTLAPASGADQIKAHARELGFQKVGIVRAEPLSHERDRLQEWLRRDYHGEMGWMARDPEQRTDPARVFPDAKSVVVVALNYYTPSQHDHDAERSADSGKVSRYAWGDDYHDVVGEKLRALLEWIRKQWPIAAGKVCVDIQPMMDKAWAQRAGLGWIGKHTNLITRDYGSWIFIGELLLNLELASDDERVEDHCGACTLCLEACPTGAIVEPYLVDSNRCISHASIESRAPELPAEITANLEGWFYGCDICQDVCPWNRFAQNSEEDRFAARAGNVDVNLSEILQLTPDEYATRFRRSAMKRAKISGLQRNARALQKGQEKERGQARVPDSRVRS